MLYGTILGLLRSLRTMPATAISSSSCISSKALHVCVVPCLPILVKTTRRLTVLYLSVHIDHTQVAYGAMGLSQGGGYAVNYLDIAPANAGLAMGLMNTFGQMAGWFAPWCLGQLTPYPQGMPREDWEQQQQQQQQQQAEATTPALSGAAAGAADSDIGAGTAGAAVYPPLEWVDEMSSEWRLVFLMAAGVQACGAAVYLLLAKAERQPWDHRTH